MREIEKAFAAENVVIAEVGAWVNMLDPDAEKRAKNLRYVIERLALAEAVGARCCLDIAGSYNPKVWYGPHPKNLSQEFFDATVENCRHVIDEVKPKRTKFTIEMMGWSHSRRAGFVSEADPRRGPLGLRRPHGRLQRHQQPRQVLPQRRIHYRVLPQAGAVDRFLPCQGSAVGLSELNVHFLEVVPGRGEVDYRTYLTRAFEAARRCAADAGTSEDRRRIRRGQALHSESCGASSG